MSLIYAYPSSPSSSFSTFSRRAKNRPLGRKVDLVIAADAEQRQRFHLSPAADISLPRNNLVLPVRPFVPSLFCFLRRLFFGPGDNNKVEE